MSSKVELAKQLLAKAKELNDEGLIQMALDLLSDENPVEETPKPQRKKRVPKKAPVNRKEKVKKVEKKIITADADFLAPSRTDESKQKQKKVRYDENGNPVGSYGRTEQIQINQKFFDDGKTDKNDKVNKKLKKLTKHTPRTRKSNLISTTCTGCGKPFTVNAILMRQLTDDNGKPMGYSYTCNICTMRRGRGLNAG